MKAWLVVILTATLSAAAAPAMHPAQDGAQDALRIVSAIYGSAAGSADVTPIVRVLTRPDLDEFYVAPHWLQVDPSVGQTKQLVVSYEFRGKPHVLTTTEPGPVSYRILLEAADPSLRPAPPTDGPSDTPSIATAYYGLGANFTLVTARSRELIRPESGTLVVDGPILGVRAGPANAVLILTYVYAGARHTMVTWRGARISHDALVTYAAADLRGEGSKVTPAWFAGAKPDPPRDPGTAGPGTGRAPRRELGISELLKAAAELRAIAPEERSPAVSRALTLTESALAEAQRDIGYPYPPPTSAPAPATEGPAAIHVTAAIGALNTALNQFNAATPGRRGARGQLPATVSRIREALTLLQY